MRAGLLSQPPVIQRLNQQFVCATIPAYEVSRLAHEGNPLAREVFRHWEVPLVLAFFDSEGRFVTKMSSLKELNQVHPETSRRPEAPQTATVESEGNNTRVFLQHLDRYFPRRP